MVEQLRMDKHNIVIQKCQLNFAAADLDNQEKIKKRRQQYDEENYIFMLYREIIVMV